MIQSIFTIINDSITDKKQTYYILKFEFIQSLRKSAGYVVCTCQKIGERPQEEDRFHPEYWNLRDIMDQTQHQCQKGNFRIDRVSSLQL